MKKHFTQMTQDEIRFLLSEVRSRTLSFGQHAFDRMHRRDIRETQILASISYCSVVEAHNDVPGELRVLVRGKVRGDFVCTVVSLTANQVVTCYWNKAGDYHKTLDRTVYTWEVNLVGLKG